MPSLHAAFTFLVAIFLVARIRSRWRHLLWLYPVLMAFALVYSGEHYFVDVLAGWIYAAAVYFGIEWAIERYRAKASVLTPHLSGAAMVAWASVSGVTPDAEPE